MWKRRSSIIDAPIDGSESFILDDEHEVAPVTEIPDDRPRSGLASRRAILAGGAAVAGGFGLAALGIDGGIQPAWASINTPLCVQDAPYNCVGNGTTDDGNGFQTAINDAVAAGRDLYVPAGTYLMRSTGTTIKRLAVDWTGATAPLKSIRIFGDGLGSSILKWKNSIGAGQYAINVVGAGDNFLIIEDLSLQGTGSWVDPNGTLATTGEGYGLRLSNRIIARNVSSFGFYAGFVINGDSGGTNTDHIDTDQLQAQENFFGLYVLGNTGATRDWNFNRLLLSRNQRANVACADDGFLPDVTFQDCHFNAAPYAFHKEDSAAQQLFMDIVTFVRCKSEGAGNAIFYGLGADLNGIHNGGTLNKLKGDLEMHGIEINGNTAGTENNLNNHTYRPIVVSGSITRDGTGSNTSVTCTTTLAHGLVPGDHFAVWAGVDNESLNGCFIASAGTTGSTLNWKQVGAAHSATGGTIGPLYGIRGGVMQQCDLNISLQTDTSGTTTMPEQFWSLYTIDNTKLRITDGDRIPSIRIRASSKHGQDVSCEFSVGDTYAYLARAAGIIVAGSQCEGSTSGDVVTSATAGSTAGTVVPWAGMALQPAATTESVDNNVVSRVWLWLGWSGRFLTGNGTLGVGAHYNTNPGDNALLMEDPDPLHHGDVAVWDKSTSVRRIVGRSIKNGSGGFIQVHLQPAYLIRT